MRDPGSERGRCDLEWEKEAMKDEPDAALWALQEILMLFILLLALRVGEAREGSGGGQA